MLGFGGIQELLLLMMVIAVLSMTGLWPRIIQGLRELRGDIPTEPPIPPKDVDAYYKILGISSTATWPEIEQAYRRKAKIHHPDLGGDEDTMRVLNDAYSHLKRIRRLQH